MNQSISPASLTLLPAKNRKVLQRLSSVLGRNARLSGGTALMFYLKHRRSYDFDFFFSKSLAVSHLERKLIKSSGHDVRLLYASSDQINIEWKNILISLIHFPFIPLGKTLQIGMINITSLRDLASEKVYSIGRREEWRDYVDLYSILINGALSIEQIITDCNVRFGEGFSERLFLNQLSAVSNVRIQPIDWLWNEPQPKMIHKFFRKLVRDIVKRKIK
ncbi:MAG: hypothetical protein ACPL28_08080 [bacterium]